MAAAFVEVLKYMAQLTKQNITKSELPDTNIEKGKYQEGYVASDGYVWTRRENGTFGWRKPKKDKKQTEQEKIYERVKSEAEEIIQGHKRISCLPEEAEEGRIRGGRRNVEASCLIGRSESTNGHDTDSIRKVQETKLEEWAKQEKIWFDIDDIRENWKTLVCGTACLNIYRLTITVRDNKLYNNNNQLSC